MHVRTTAIAGFALGMSLGVLGTALWLRPQGTPGPTPSTRRLAPGQPTRPAPGGPLRRAALPTAPGDGLARGLASATLALAGPSGGEAPPIERAPRGEPETSEDALIDLTVRLASADPDERAEALDDAFTLHDKIAALARDAYTSDPEPSVRATALVVLSEMGSIDAIADLAQALEHDVDPSVRSVAAEELAMALSDEAIVPLMAALQEDPDPEVRRLAILGLGHLDGATVAEALRKAAGEEASPDLRLLAAQAHDLVRARMSRPDVPLSIEQARKLDAAVEQAFRRMLDRRTSGSN